MKAKDTCDNCGRSTPGKWMCAMCAEVFDGDQFHNDLLPDDFFDWKHAKRDKYKTKCAWGDE